MRDGVYFVVAPKECGVGICGVPARCGAMTDVSVVLCSRVTRVCPTCAVSAADPKDDLARVASSRRVDPTSNRDTGSRVCPFRVEIWQIQSEKI